MRKKSLSLQQVNKTKFRAPKQKWLSELNRWSSLREFNHGSTAYFGSKAPNNSEQ